MRRHGFDFGVVLAGALMLAGGSAQAAGPQLFTSRCSMCHQTTGMGLPGQFPPLAGRVSQIAAKEEGRAYLIKVLLYGLYGSIKAGGVAYNGLMPTMGTMSDQDIADVLNHAASLKKVGKPAAFTADEVAKVRAGAKLSSSAVATERARVAATGIIP
jgi:mono/diheme cytochrome c family protein